MKKLTSIILVAIIAFALVPTTIYATDEAYIYNEEYPESYPDEQIIDISNSQSIDYPQVSYYTTDQVHDNLNGQIFSYPDYFDGQVPDYPDYLYCYADYPDSQGYDYPDEQAPIVHIPPWLDLDWVVPQSHDIDWYFFTYREPDFLAVRTERFEPQTVYIFYQREDGWGLKETYRGFEWVYLNSNRMHTRYMRGIYAYAGARQRYSIVSPQMVTIIAQDGNWAQINTWLGPKWLYVYFTTERRVVYLTFDDGPSRNNTPVILDILQEMDVRATFFVLPRSGVDDLYMRIVNEGHVIANHSFSHDIPRLFSDVEFFEADLRRAHNFIRNMTGQTPTIYRFPGGSGGRSSEVMAPRLAALRRMGYRHFNWDLSINDTDTGPAGRCVDTLINNIIMNTRNRHSLVILMHDTSFQTTTVQALPTIIAHLRAMGYEFDTLDNF